MHCVRTSTSGRAEGHWRERRSSRLHARLAGLLLLFCWAALGNLGNAVAQTSEATASAKTREGNVRQVVLGIISFTRWPTPPAKVHLCVSGNTDYARDLLSGPLPGSGLRIEAQRMSVAEPAIGSQCDVLYLGVMTDAERRQVLANIAGHPVLTISERNDSCTAGTMFCLNVDPDRVTFDINLDTVARSGVRVHPNVLKLARKPGTP